MRSVHCRMEKKPKTPLETARLWRSDQCAAYLKMKKREMGRMAESRRAMVRIMRRGQRRGRRERGSAGRTRGEARDAWDAIVAVSRGCFSSTDGKLVLELVEALSALARETAGIFTTRSEWMLAGMCGGGRRMEWQLTAPGLLHRGGVGHQSR